MKFDTSKIKKTNRHASGTRNIILMITLMLFGIISFLKDYINSDSFVLRNFILVVTILIVMVASCYFLLKDYHAIYKVSKAERRFWRNFALQNNGIYQEMKELATQNSLILSKTISFPPTNFIDFKNQDGLHVSFFTFYFIEPIRFFKSNFSYTVIMFTVNAQMPHLYLNYLKNKFNPSPSNPLSLPWEFNKFFSLFVPRKYEIEALQIFTSDVLEKILHVELKMDVELVDDKIIFFIEHPAVPIFSNHLSKIQEKYPRIEEIVQLLIPKIEKFSFEKIGDKSPYLS